MGAAREDVSGSRTRKTTLSDRARHLFQTRYWRGVFFGACACLQPVPERLS